jgi:hypothetical protein
MEQRQTPPLEHHNLGRKIALSTLAPALRTNQCGPGDHMQVRSWGSDQGFGVTDITQSVKHVDLRFLHLLQPSIPTSLLVYRRCAFRRLFFLSQYIGINVPSFSHSFVIGRIRILVTKSAAQFPTVYRPRGRIEKRSALLPFRATLRQSSITAQPKYLHHTHSIRRYSLAGASASKAYLSRD